MRRALGMIEPACYFCCGSPGAIDIGLHFDERDRSFRQPAVAVKDGIVAVFPTLVDQPIYGLASVFDEAVAILIAVFLDPCKGGLDVGP